MRVFVSLLSQFGLGSTRMPFNMELLSLIISGFSHPHLEVKENGKAEGEREREREGEGEGEGEEEVLKEEEFKEEVEESNERTVAYWDFLIHLH
ncbi:uncharacterized protein MONOS_18243 [Monocercomonoides exilis]|uniref:uncharacterized protein n=1 Tax=Monocercomonoides exilis TaxID=2049356 RepID=UPI00355A045E|nr:hypothetical protein MONOS_18243 [Monocercomonoides exilis]